MFGSPRSGDIEFQRLFANRFPGLLESTARFVNAFDIVPHVPLNAQDSAADGSSERLWQNVEKAICAALPQEGSLLCGHVRCVRVFCVACVWCSVVSHADTSYHVMSCCHIMSFRFASNHEVLCCLSMGCLVMFCNLLSCVGIGIDVGSVLCCAVLSLCDGSVQLYVQFFCAGLDTQSCVYIYAYIVFSFGPFHPSMYSALHFEDGQASRIKRDGTIGQQDVHSTDQHM